MVAVVVGLAPPTPLQPRVCGPPTSTPGPTPFKCGRVPGGSVSSSLTCIHRLCWPMLFPMALHRRSGHPSHHHTCLCPFNVVSSRCRGLDVGAQSGRRHSDRATNRRVPHVFTFFQIIQNGMKHVKSEIGTLHCPIEGPEKATRGG
jgi:hypothetical protein